MDVKELDKAKGQQTCLRLYPRNNCLHDHHAFLLRGCFMGLTMLSRVSVKQVKRDDVADVVDMTAVLGTAVAFSWPGYLLIQLIFVITFSTELVFENSALVSLMMPCFVMLASFIYTLGLQHVATDCVEQFALIVEKKLQVCNQVMCGSVLADPV